VRRLTTVLLSIAVLAGALLLRRHRRRAARAPLAAPERAARLALPGPAARFVSVPWTLVAAPADEPHLAVRCRADERMELDRVDAQETPTQVFVTALMRRRPPAGTPIEHEQEHEVIVPLAAPLGTRELVHAPIDEPGDPPLYP